MAFRLPNNRPIEPKGKRRRARVQPDAPGQRHPRVHDRDHLACIAALPSVISGIGPVVCAHIRYAEHARGKPHTGLGEKPDDKWALPLTPEEHTDADDAQHRSNERIWWETQGIDPLPLCEALYEASGNLPLMEELVAMARGFAKQSIASRNRAPGRAGKDL